ncbi:hypothetical protein D3C85_1735050 [compost metagenome]
MALRHCHHQGIAPGLSGDDAIADLIRLGEPHVIQIVVQPLDLLRQRHFRQANLDFRLLLPA